MKVYVGWRDESGAQVRVIKRPHYAATLHHYVRHSPTGFEWGYGGSGPADLARAIVADVFGLATADRVYQDFKRRTVARFDRDAWILTERQVIAIVDELLAAEPGVEAAHA